MEEKGIVRSVRGDKETFERLADITKAQFGNQGEALAAIIAAWDLQQAKTATPNRKTEIEDFDTHLQALSTAYVHSLQIAESADARARAALDAELKSKDALIRDLQAQLQVARTSAKLAEQEQEEAETETQNVKKALETAERQTSDANARAEAAERRAAEQLEDKDKLISSLTAQLAETSERARQNNAASERAESLKAELDKAKRELTDAKNAATVAAAKAEAEQALAVSKARDSATTELLKAMMENSALKVEVERLKARITLLESPKATTAAPMSDEATPPAPAQDTSNVGKDKAREAKAAANRRKAQKKPAPQKGAEEKKEIPGLEEARNLREAWAQYRAEFRASFEGNDSKSGTTTTPEPSVTLEDYLKDHPAAAAYLRAEDESLKTNYKIASIGKRALDRITANPDDYAAAIEQMEADFHAYADRHMWD